MRGRKSNFLETAVDQRRWQEMWWKDRFKRFDFQRTFYSADIFLRSRTPFCSTELSFALCMFQTVVHPFVVLSVLGSLKTSKPQQQWQRQRQRLQWPYYVRCNPWYISLSLSTRQQREVTTFCVYSSEPPQAKCFRILTQSYMFCLG